MKKPRQCPRIFPRTSRHSHSPKVCCDINPVRIGEEACMGNCILWARPKIFDSALGNNPSPASAQPLFRASAHSQTIAPLSSCIHTDRIILASVTSPDAKYIIDLLLLKRLHRNTPSLREKYQALQKKGFRLRFTFLLFTFPSPRELIQLIRFSTLRRPALLILCIQPPTYILLTHR